MIELPEALTLARQVKEKLTGITVTKVFPPQKADGFTWFNGDPANYGALLTGRRITGAEGFGIFAEVLFEGEAALCVNDGANMRYLGEKDKRPDKYRLLIELDGGSALLFTVAMYGGIFAYKGAFTNEYYLKSRNSVSPLSDGFDEGYFEGLIAAQKKDLSMKALLAAEQRIPGVGNGCVQDILYNAGLHPKRKLSTLSDGDKERLLKSIKNTLREITDKGGRDTEKDLFGAPGGYRTLMSNKSLAGGCPGCGGKIVKEAFLGGAVYYCPECQKL